MIFKPLQYDSGKIKTMKAGDNKTFEKGDPLKFVSGKAERSDADADEVRFIALESVEDSADEQEFLALYTGGVEFEAETQADTDQDQVDQVFALHADRNVENSTSYTAGDVFLVTEIVGVTADKKVRGYFLDRKEKA